MNLEKETAILKELQHTNVVQCYGVVWEPPNLGIAMPLALHGTLSTFIGQHDVQWAMKVKIDNNQCVLFALSRMIDNSYFIPFS